MDTEASLRDTFKNGSPTPFNPQKYSSSGIFLGGSTNFNQQYPPMYNSYFPGQQTNPVGYQQPPSFLFRERKGRVNWRNLANLDVDDLIGRGDIKALETHLSNITFANLEREDLEKFGDATLLKLFRLSQYGLEYLLNCQNYLANQTLAMDNQYKYSQDLLRPLEEQARRNQAEIVNLKSEVRNKKDLLNAYQNTLSAPFFKCHLCSKFFKSQDFLSTHFQRRHPNSMNANQEATVLQKTVLKDTATSPSTAKPADRYNRIYAEDEEQEQERGRGAKAEQSVAVSQQLPQSTVHLEKLIQQLKEDEGLKLSQLTSTIQDRLDQVLESNKNLTAKVSELERKLETQSLSPERKRTIGKDREYASATKGDSEDTADISRDGFDETLKRGLDSKEAMEELQRKKTPRKSSLKENLTAGATLQFYNAGSLQDVKEDVKDEVTLIQLQKQQFRAGSLADVEEEQQQQKPIYVYPVTQVFRAGELETVNEDIGVSRQGAIKEPIDAGKWTEVRKQVFRSGEIENVKEEQKQVFRSGDLRNDKDTLEDLGLVKSGGLEDDEESMKAENFRKFSQGDFVIVEQEEEDEHGDQEEGELDADTLREKHKNLTTKASNVINNKYREPVTKEQEQKARQQLEKEVNSLFKQLYNVEYEDMSKQKTEDLEKMLKDLRKFNKKNYEDLHIIENKHKNSQKQNAESTEKQSTKRKLSQEAAKNALLDSQKFEASQLKNNKGVMQSGELMNLLMTQGGRERESGSSQDPSSVRRQVFESQNLEMQLGSVEDVKKSGSLIPKNMPNGRESGADLVKKSIEIGITEQL